MKVLMVGLGSIGQRHLRNLKALLGNDLEILAWRSRGRQDVLTDQLVVQPDVQLDTFYGIKVFDDLEVALRAKPDVAFITNPTGLHMPAAIAVARAGCHLFIEKPLSHTLQGVDELLALVEAKGLIAAVGYNMRFHPALRLMKSLLDNGTIGSLLAVRFEQGEYLPGRHPYEDYRDTYTAHRALGGGLLLSQIHELDVTYWLFGMPARVFALGGHWSNLDIDVEDVTSLLLECCYDGRALPVHVQQDYVRRPPVRRYEIVGERGILVADLLRPDVQLTLAPGESTVHQFEQFQRNDMFTEELKHFLRCLRREETPAVGIREAAQSLRIAVAAKQSLVEGGVVRVAGASVPSLKECPQT